MLNIRPIVGRLVGFTCPQCNSENSQLFNGQNENFLHSAGIRERRSIVRSQNLKKEVFNKLWTKQKISNGQEMENATFCQKQFKTFV